MSSEYVMNILRMLIQKALRKTSEEMIKRVILLLIFGRDPGVIFHNDRPPKPEGYDGLPVTYLHSIYIRSVPIRLLMRISDTDVINEPACTTVDQRENPWQPQWDTLLCNHLCRNVTFIPTYPFSPTVSPWADNFSCLHHPFPSHHFPLICMILAMPTLLSPHNGIPYHHAHSFTPSLTFHHLFSL